MEMFDPLLHELTFRIRGWPTLTPFRAFDVRKLCVNSFMLRIGKTITVRDVNKSMNLFDSNKFMLVA